ncbi:MAG TPA: hypothetical protein H9822_05375 [Candidatus Yaniella excrementavium]|nr:hypothetical protein [Candidatus Yaniella excrementavium]
MQAFYWFTWVLGSSFWPYFGERHGDWPLAEHNFANIRRWTVMTRGGHFAALEQPEHLAREIVEFSAK